LITLNLSHAGEGGFGLDAVIRLFFSDDRFVALSSRSQPEIRSFGSKRLLSPGPDVRCGCDVCLTCGTKRTLNQLARYQAFDARANRVIWAVMHSSAFENKH